jgi:sulfoxide reductase heme-binding subunit YedZ
VKDPTFWILARASGLTAYVLLTLSVVAGLVLKSRPFAQLKPAYVTETHRTLALLSLGALGLHAVSLVLDETVRVSLAALVVPGLVDYRPVWTAAGVLAGDLVLLVIASFWVRRRIGMKNWRRLHWTTYAVFTLATVHGLFAGTDSRSLVSLYVGAVLTVVFATAWRALVPPVRPKPKGAPSCATAS